jgi:hypothetical protein
MKANLENIQRIYSEIPYTFTYEGVRIDNYAKSNDHYLHGWRDVVIPEITTSQRLGNDYILIDNIVTKEVIIISELELQEIEFAKIAPLQKIVLDKIKRYSLALAMGKSINDDLEYFEKAYRNKYKMAKAMLAYLLDNTLPNPDPYNTLLTESVLEGYATLIDYLNDIVLKFDNGSQFMEIALQMSEVLRKLIMNDITALDYTKAIDRLEIVNQLESDITAGEVNGIFQQVLNL